MASGGHSALEMHLTVEMLWLTQKPAVVLATTFGSFTRIKRGQHWGHVGQKFAVIAQKPKKRLRFGAT